MILLFKKSSALVEFGIGGTSKMRIGNLGKLHGIIPLTSPALVLCRTRLQPASRKMTKRRMKGDRRKITTWFWIHTNTVSSGRASGSCPRRQVIKDCVVCDLTTPSHIAETVIIVDHTPSHFDNSKPIAISLFSSRDNTYHRLPPIPQVESGIPWNCHCVALDEKLYILGGTTEPTTSVNNTLQRGSKEVYVVDLSGQRQWKRCARMQEARPDFRCGVIDGKIYVFGETSLDPAVPGSEVYDPSIDAWSGMSLEEQWLYSQGMLSHSIAFYRLKVLWETVVDEDAEGSTSGEELQPSHGKEVYTYYSIKKIAGDGRCLFRSVAHGSSLRCGNGELDEKQQQDLADDLRKKAADELERRRNEYEDILLGEFEIDFDKYVKRIRNPGMWGGEIEVVMLTHVLQMPITVYIADQRIRHGLISLGDYGQEYGTDHPIQILYHPGYHYEALQVFY